MHPKGNVRSGPLAEQIGAHHAQREAVVSELSVQGSGRLSAVLDHSGKVVLKVTADPWKVDAHIDAVLGELLGWSHPGKHEDVG